jgi:hypothetical protein
MPWCYAAESALELAWCNGTDATVRRGRECAGTAGGGALSDTAALGDRGMRVLQRSCSDRDEGRWFLPDAMVLRGRMCTDMASGPVAGQHGRPENHCSVYRPRNERPAAFLQRS